MKYLLYLAPVIFFAACIDNINIDLPDIESSLVMHSTLSPDTTITVYLSNSAPVSSATTPTDQTDATVELYEDGNLVGRLKYVGPDTITVMNRYDRYLRSKYEIDYYPIAGRSYQLTAQVNGYKSVTGETTIPAAATGSIKDLKYQGSTEVGGDKIVITIADNKSGPNYYMLVPYRSDTIYDTKRDTVIIYPEENSYLSLSNLNIGIDVPQDDRTVLATDAQGILLKDSRFDNSSMMISLFVYPRVGYGGSYIPTIKSRARFVLRTVSEDYYNYWKSIDDQSQTYDNPLIEPVIINSNVENGYGLVSSYVSNEKTIIFDNK